jgi:TolB-like protein/Tfp pilus assembly protein PilF
MPVPLRPKVYDLLVAIIKAGGTMATKEYLMKEVWPDTVVTDNSLTVAICALREALDDKGELITIPGHGYRFLADVKEFPSMPATSTPFGERQNVHNTLEPLFSTLAILPFNTIGVKRGGRQLEMGLAESLITRLSRFSQIKVRPAFAFAMNPLRRDPCDVGRELNVETILTGSIQWHDNRIRVTVELVQSRTGISFWAEKFDEEITDLFSMQDLMSERIAHALVSMLNSHIQRQRSDPYTENREAYRAYLKATYFCNKRTEASLRLGLKYFADAVRLDPGFALGHVGIADCYLLQAIYCALPASDLWCKAKAAAMKALEIDHNLAAAHASLGYAHLNSWNWDDAAREMDRALELDPSNATAHHWYSDYLAALGKLDGAVLEMQAALEIDPLSLAVNTNLGLMLLFSGQYENAMAQLKETLKLDPDFAHAHVVLGEVYAQCGQYEEAIKEFRRARRDGDCAFASAEEGYTLALAGRSNQAKQVIKAMANSEENGRPRPESFALVYAGLGHLVQAFLWLERAFSYRSSSLVYLRVMPGFKGLQYDPRFEDLLNRMGLAAGPAASALHAIID